MLTSLVSCYAVYAVRVTTVLLKHGMTEGRVYCVGAALRRPRALHTRGGPEGALSPAHPGDPRVMLMLDPWPPCW